LHITIKHNNGQYPSFDILLHTTPEQEAFLTIKSCKIMNGSKGEFVSYPSKKMDNGKYWNHLYASEAFNANILKKAKVGSPPAQAPKPPPLPLAADRFGPDMDDDVPF
jgi:DNA-binding cell septation regulator SpoVG